MKPWQTDGAYYGYGPNGERHCRGARMGRPTILPADPKTPIKLRMEHLRFNSGNCYDEGGAYWGSPDNLYCAYADRVQIFERAASRDLAKAKIREQLPAAKFYN